MPIFLEIFALFLLGTCAVVSSPVPTGKGKRIVLFLSGAALWVGAIILVRSQEEILLDFLFSDWALSGALANQVVASLVVFGFGWFFFVAKSLRATRVEIQWGDPRFDLNSSTRQWAQGERVFRPWPSILIWLPVVVLLAGIWFVPARFNHVDLEPTVNLTATVTATNTPTATSTKTPTAMATSTPTATPEPTITPTATETATSEPTATQVATSTNPNMPPLACEGEWLHPEPFKIGVIRQAFEQCPDGSILLHYPDNKTAPMPFEGMTIMTQVQPYRFEFTIESGGEIFVNGAPFDEWFATQGGQ